MNKYRIAVFIALYLSAVSASFIEDTLENVSYLAIKKALLEAGDTEFHANCVVEVLKVTGTTKDVTDMIFEFNMNLSKLNDKWKFADFVCTPPGLIVAALLFGLALCICCCCLIRCCKCRTKKPIIIHMPPTHVHSHRTASVPYVKMDVA
ncbi:uncharacterized protein LOC119066169 [Bradysia coprophila]|uniref:uncharacterized protein LOC119066169 n=1 Tax=Bradysia coprophila TaxID=38358 RepID=UPI00187D853E|nr:uncharacterized protein LOC119066169 [Bradysia coprophila]